MFKTLKNAWKIEDLRKKMIFTVAIVLLYRLGASLPVPYISSSALSSIMSIYGGSSIFSYLNILSGQAFSRATLFALSVSPYITASIVIQLLTVAIPALERLSKNGEDGREKIKKYTRIVTVILSVITAYGYYAYMRSVGVVINDGWFTGLVIVSCYCAGAALIMWLAEKINENGIGNGISIILFANIVSSFYTVAQTIIHQFTEGWLYAIFAVISIVLIIAIITLIVFFTNSERRLPVQYAKKVVGRKMYGGQNSNLPLKLDMSGVMPIIFSSSIVSIPATINMIFPAKSGSFGSKIVALFDPSSWLYTVLFIVLIFAFAYFYIGISFDPIEVANNLKRNGGFIPGYRPGKPTADYIRKILKRITLIGAVFLAVIAGLPLIINICASGYLGALAFGGSSRLIAVGVALETARELEAQMTMRHYKGFLE